MSHLAIAGRRIGPGEPVFFVVEEGQANRGDYTLALRMIDLAAATGADAIEFQFAEADGLYARGHAMHAVYQKREFSDEQLRGIREHVQARSLAAIATALGERMVERVAAAGFDAICVNSSDICNPRMLDAAASSGLPFFVGTAMASLDEIDWAFQRLGRHQAPFGLLHGQHVMAAEETGVPPDRVHLRTLATMRERYGVPVGFIDHTATTVMPPLAAAHGAAAVTKHMSPQEGWKGPDWQICQTPEQMAECVRLVRTAERAAGSADKPLIPGELEDRPHMRRSIVAARSMTPGTVLSNADLKLVRPGTGLDCRHVEALLGRRLIASVAEDEPLSPAMLEG